MDPAHGQSALSEKDLIRLFRSEAISLKATAAQRDQSELNSSLLKEAYMPQGYGSFRYGDSNEKSLSPFQPTLGPTTNLLAGIRKRYAYGVAGSAEVFTQEVSTTDGNLDRAAQFGGRASVSLDLWRNYLGKLDQSTVKSAEIGEVRTALEAEINERISELSLRKAFWSILALDESLKVNEELLRSAERQLKEARKRGADGVADRGEIARYQAQIESRKATQITLELQRQYGEGAIKRQIASLQGQRIRLAPVNLQEEENKFQICSKQILTQNETPLPFAASAELLSKLKEEFDQKQAQAALHSSPDLFLELSMQRSGVDQGAGPSTEDFVSKGKLGYSIGLNLTVPLGEQSDFSERKLLSAQKNAYDAQTLQLKHDLSVLHSDTRQALRLLAQALETQSNESRFLTINLDESRQKFNQGRIPVSLLIQEQDSLFASRLTEIDIKRQIVHAMYDYFQVFTRHPCPMNRLVSNRE